MKRDEPETWVRDDQQCCKKCSWHQAPNGQWYCPYGGPFTHYIHGYGPDAQLEPITREKTLDKINS